MSPALSNVSRRLLLLLVLNLALVAKVEAEVWINELLAANQLGLVDDDGEPTDWIEIHNTGTESVDLAGWSLTDDPNLVQKWSFPSRILGANDYLIVFASGKDRVDSAALHTNFKLASEGEFLALSDAQGTFVSTLEPSFPKLMRDHSYGLDAVTQEYRHWRTPTPGSINQEAPELGPTLSNPQSASLLAEESIDHVVSIDVNPNGAPIESVMVRQRIMFKAESTFTLNDDGIAPDVLGGDGRFTGKMSANTLFGKRHRAGEMMRWAFIARDEDGKESRLPELKAGVVAQPHYFGTIVAQTESVSDLPVLHWFAENPDRAVTTSGNRASVFFDGQFFDNIFVKRRGQSGAIGWPKPKLKFDFNPREHFRYDPERRLVEEFNLQSHFNDASFMRENLAFGFFNEIGTPASDTRHWHIRLNGDFYGLFSCIEQVDQDFLRQQGLDPNGALYKANGFPATLGRSVTPALYQKDTRKDEPYDDLVAFAKGINGPDRFHYIMDHVNLPAMVNEMAGQSLIRNADRLTKNYYMYRDPETDLWQRIPWDMDGAFSTSANLATENYASPLYGDSSHTQAPGQAIYQNFLLDAILDHKLTRQMYLRRLRTLIDTYLTDDYAYFHSNIDERLAKIRLDAQADAKLWSTGNIDGGVSTLKNTAFALRRRELLETFGKDLVPAMQTTGLNLILGEVEASPDDPLAEYFQIINPNNEAIDLTGWEIRGAVRLEFPSGTVIPKKGTLFNPNDGIMHVVRNVRAFRDRTKDPKGNLGLFFVGPYEGKLSAQGETIQLLNAADVLVAELSFPPTEGFDLEDYAFGESPRIEIVAPNRFRYRRAAKASDLVFVVESSADLLQWQEEQGLTEQVINASDGLYEQVTITLATPKAHFVRVKAQQTE